MSRDEQTNPISTARSAPNAIQAVQLKVTLKYIRPPSGGGSSLRPLLLGLSSLGHPRGDGLGQQPYARLSIDNSSMPDPRSSTIAGPVRRDFFLHQVIKRSGHVSLTSMILATAGSTKSSSKRSSPPIAKLPCALFEGRRACPRETAAASPAMSHAGSQAPSNERTPVVLGRTVLGADFDPEHFDLAAINQLSNPSRKNRQRGLPHKPFTA